jgi:SSS family solute:Na+ symporter
VTLTFLALLLFAQALAFAARRPQAGPRPEDFFVAAGQFGAARYFFLAVGETYSVVSILGFPGGVYAHGSGFVSWFLGYILLSFPAGYFLYPWIWRAGRLHGAVTLPDMFARHFGSRTLELTLSLASLTFLLPLGVMQFVGLNTVLGDLGWHLPRLLLSCLGGLLAFATVARSGIRAPAGVAVLKDVLILAAILVTAVACLRAAPGDLAGALVPAGGPTTNRDATFSMTTILLQSVGFCMVPQTCAAVFTARSADAIRRAQVAMPLYMLMFPLLMLVAVYALRHHLQPATPDDVFLAAARAVLPGWMVGVVMAAAALSALVVLSGVCLAIGPLITRNVVPGLDGAAQQFWSKIVIAFYLLFSIAGAARFHDLMVALNNLFYFGITQSFPGLIAMLFVHRARPAGIIAGLIAGDALAVALHVSPFDLGGCNPGLIGLAANAGIVFGTACLLPGRVIRPVASHPG